MSQNVSKWMGRTQNCKQFLWQFEGVRERTMLQKMPLAAPVSQDVLGCLEMSYDVVGRHRMS